MITASFHQIANLILKLEDEISIVVLHRFCALCFNFTHERIFVFGCPYMFSLFYLFKQSLSVFCVSQNL